MRKDIIFWIVGSLLLVFTLTGIGYAATFLFDKNRALQAGAPSVTEPVRFYLDGIDELGISGANIDTSTDILVPESVVPSKNATSAPGE